MTAFAGNRLKGARNAKNARVFGNAELEVIGERDARSERKVKKIVARKRTPRIIRGGRMAEVLEMPQGT